jgi:threonine/homoserine/homoserine lactone efflux protein
MLVSIVTFTLSTVMTPGPNNIMLLSSGLTFGYKKTLPHIFGVMFGFAFMVVLVGLGMGVIFETYPFIFSILKIVGILYLFWMAYKIATSVDGYEVDPSKQKKPFTFLQAAAFQWVNPKAWIMAITAISVFVTSKEDSLIQVFIIAFIYLLSGVISTNSWALGGVMLKKVIKNSSSVRKFNIVMAILLVLSIIPFMFE